MPKISAPTVAQHRAAQRSALLRAAEALLVEAGVAGVTPRTVGERAGLARSSFYEYFSSKDDLLTAVAIEAFDQWAAEIDTALDDVEQGLPRLKAFIDATMRMTADGKHEIASVLQQADLSPSSFDDIMALHDKLMSPVKSVLDQLGVPDLTAHAALVQGLLNAGVQLVGHGIPHATASAQIFDLLTHGLPIPTQPTHHHPK